MSEELKNCPFCGKPFEFGDALTGWTIVHNSQDCPMESQGANGWIWRTPELLLTAVNRRPIEDALRKQLGASKDTIRMLLSLLPDSHHIDNCWNWCWDELNGDAQDAVKNGRNDANNALAAIEKIGGNK